MTSDFEKRSTGSTEATGMPADVTASGVRQGYTGTGSTSGTNQSGFGDSLPEGQRLSGVETAFGQRGSSGNDAGSRTDGGVADAARREAQSAKAEFGSATDTVRQGVSSLGETAREKAYEGVEKGKSQITSSIDDFAAAVRKASDELGERDQSMAANLVREVANGLEQATGAIQGKSVQDLTRSVASFARRQPTTFLIGAALAGVALGRFARASSDHSDTGSRSASGWNEGDSGRYDEGLYRNDGGATRSSGSGLTPGRSASATPVSPPVSAGTTAPRSATVASTTGSPFGGSATDRLSTGATTSSLGSGSAGSTGTRAPGEGPSDAVLGHGSGSFNPKGDHDVR